jgi:hypothetical protein
VIVLDSPAAAVLYSIAYNPIAQPPTQHSPLGRPPWERQLLLCKARATYAAELKAIPKGIYHLVVLVNRLEEAERRMGGSCKSIAR